MARSDLIVVGGLALLAGLGVLSACSSSPESTSKTCTNGNRDGDESGVDCGGSCPLSCDALGIDPAGTDGGTGEGGTQNGPPARSDDNLKNGSETDVDCGGTNAPKCAEGKSCLVDNDCEVACSYAKKCIMVPSCKPHLGGDTCGKGEVDEPSAVHESCCRSLPVPGFTDPAHPGKTVYLDKYEITAGRVRAFIADITARSGGKPNIREWIVNNTPPIWDPAWSSFLPTDNSGPTIRVNRLLLGDRRPGADESLPPEFDQDLNVGLEYQFGPQLFVYLHGNNCSTHNGAFGFPTFFYPAAVLARDGFAPRADGLTNLGAPVPASEHLEVKSMNCISNAMLAAFCHWDGGQLATDDVLDFVTASPPSMADRPGCGTQIGWENPPTRPEAVTGGRCADLALVNASYDAGGQLPVPGHPLNENRYRFPIFPDGTTHDKAWEIAAPGRGSLAAGWDQTDLVRINPGDEPWMDLHGNLNESVLSMDGETFSGKFGLKYRGIGFQSSRSELNTKADWEGEGGLKRIQRPEARAAFAGGRCMRFK